MSRIPSRIPSRHVRTRLTVSVVAISGLVAAAVPAVATEHPTPQVTVEQSDGPQDVIVSVRDRGTAQQVTVRSLDPMSAAVTISATYNTDGATYEGSSPWAPVEGSKVLYDLGQAAVSGAAAPVFACQTATVTNTRGTPLGSTVAAGAGSFVTAIDQTPDPVLVTAGDTVASTTIFAGQPTAPDASRMTAFSSQAAGEGTIEGAAGTAERPRRLRGRRADPARRIRDDRFESDLPATPLSAASDSYWVVAQTESWNGGSLPSDAVVVAAAAIETPSDLAVASGYEAAYLDWTAMADASSYNVYRSFDGQSYERIASHVRFSEWNEYGLVNGSTYWFYVTAQYGSLESAPSAEVSTTAVADKPEDWAACAAPADTRCIASFTVDGATPPAGLTAHVWDEGSLQWQCRYEGDYELATTASTLTTESVIRITIDVGSESIGMVTSTGGVSALQIANDGAGHAQVEIVASPARTSWAEPGCNPSACGDDTFAADRDYTGKLIGSMAVRDAVETDALGQSWIATNAQTFSAPYYDWEADGLVFEVAAAHLRADREPNMGFFRSFLTDTALRELYGIDDPSTVTSDSFETTRDDDGSSTTMTQVDGGIIVELASFGYSSPKFTIARAVTDGGGEDNPSGTPGSDDGTAADDSVTAGTAPAGRTVDSDVDGQGPTSDDPMEVAVTTPSGGDVRIEKQTATGEASGFSLVGVQLDITAPDGTADEPLELALTIDGSAVGDSDVVAVFRNGKLVPPCTEPESGQATPDP